MTLFSLRANFFLYISKPFPYLTLHSFLVIFHPSFSLYMSFFPLSLVFLFPILFFLSSFYYYGILQTFSFPSFSSLQLPYRPQSHFFVFCFFPLSSSSLRLYTLPFFLPLLFTSCPFPPFTLHLYRPPVALLLTLNLALSTPSISITLHLQHP